MPIKTPKPWKTPKVYLLPNLMTAGNLACGFSAVFFIFQGMKDADPSANTYYTAIGFTLAACLFDALDGRIARMKGQESMFGREFDSLADVVSFGIAPALLVMDIVLSGFNERLAWTIAFIYLLCGTMRLARFNCLAEEESENASKDFVGFPIPAAAGMIASLTVFILWFNEGDREIGYWRYLLLTLVLVLSYMMLSEFSYPSFKKVNWRTRRSMPWVFVAILVFVSAINFWKVVPFFIFLTYLTYGCVRPWISRSLRKEIEEGDEDFEPELVLDGMVEGEEREKSDEPAA
ncbi:MAG: CDP-diacylglycerol--serine O-phosphatidyltransferase [Verrucomicrobiae bacterium]|nr:CDP-diacylglycerol--serine O-phosphatidyltransferase [Verrucomicrobiae bacterium]